MGQNISFYLFITAFLMVAAVTVYLIVNNDWYNAVNPIMLVFMYIGIAVVSFSMREEMLNRFEK